VPRHAEACPNCGSDDSTGWSDSAHASSLGIPDEKFDYDDFLKAEFGSHSPKPRGIHWLWWLTALILVILFLFFCLH
jgi:hypothetical protein